MSATTTYSSVNYYTYKRREGNTLIHDVAEVIGVLLPRAIVTAGFDAQGDLLMIHYEDYDAAQSPWIPDFYEHRFLNETLLAQPEKLRALFIASEKYLVVPEPLYDADEAEKWLRSLFFVERNEQIATHDLPGEKIKYAYAIPAVLKQLFEKHFTSSKLLPLSAALFSRTDNTPDFLRCVLTRDHVYATLYKNNSLQWHQVFPYQKAEDIAYRFRFLAEKFQFDAETISVETRATYHKLTPVLKELSHFFPNMRKNDTAQTSHEKSWTGAIVLFQQLYACAL